jgi:hypothetical protein
MPVFLRGILLTDSFELAMGVRSATRHPKNLNCCIVSKHEYNLFYSGSLPVSFMARLYDHGRLWYDTQKKTEYPDRKCGVCHRNHHLCHQLWPWANDCIESNYNTFLMISSGRTLSYHALGSW